MPLSANLLKLESSILPRAKRATSRNNVATEKTNPKKKVLAPDSPGAEMSGAEMATPKRTRPIKPTVISAEVHTQRNLFGILFNQTQIRL